VADHEGRVTDYSDAAAALFPSLTAAPARLEEVDPRLAAADDAVITVSADDGSRFFLRRSVPVETAGQPTGRTVVLNDVTDLEVARRELDRQNEQLDGFTAAITHELRNPLNVALGNLETVLREPPDEDCRRAVEAAHAANERMVDIVDDLTTLTTYGKSVAARADHRLSALVERAWDACDHTEARLDVVGSATVTVDRPRFVELCERTFAFCLARGATTVTVVVTDDGFRVATDLDPLDPAAAERLFEYGQQAAADDRMGLALVDTLAAAQGWTARIDPDAPDLQFVFVSVAPRSP
jgi:signal transduction histidine kinase